MLRYTYVDSLRKIRGDLQDCLRILDSPTPLNPEASGGQEESAGIAGLYDVI